MHPSIRQLDEVVNALLDDGERVINIVADEFGNWKVRIPLEKCIDFARIEYFNEFCVEHKLEWLMHFDSPDLFMELTPQKEE